MTGNKVRIYDLAKELKLESKRLIEEVRREGFDVSVPSNTVPKDLADKIRNRYFPKKETAPPRTIRVVKKQRTAEEGGEDIHASVPPVAAADSGVGVAVAEAPVEEEAEPPVEEDEPFAPLAAASEASAPEVQVSSAPAPAYRVEANDERDAVEHEKQDASDSAQ